MALTTSGSARRELKAAAGHDPRPPRGTEVEFASSASEYPSEGSSSIGQLQELTRTPHWERASTEESTTSSQVAP